MIGVLVCRGHSGHWRTCSVSDTMQTHGKDFGRGINNVPPEQCEGWTLVSSVLFSNSSTESSQLSAAGTIEVPPGGPRPSQFRSQS